jgi:hypothetical protein
VSIHRLSIRGGSSDLGGGLYCHDVDVVLRDVVLTDNYATVDGGGAYFDRCDVVASDLVVSDNRADGNGGGVWVGSSSVDVVRGRFVDNSADRGGGVWYGVDADNHILHLGASLFQGNDADDDAAALIYAGVDSATTAALVDHCVFADNLTGLSVVRIKNGRIRFLDPMFVYNDANEVFTSDIQLAEMVRALRYGNGRDAWSWPNVGNAPTLFYTSRPEVLSWVDDGRADNDVWLLRPGSLVADAGVWDTRDTDGSPAAVGLAGGPDADPWSAMAARDADGDGMSDAWESLFGLNPAVNDANLDPDGDGKSNLREYGANTLPDRRDTDGDGDWD